MGETAQILALSRRARTRGEKICLATVVHVEGSSYRKPGARMLITSGGERAGTISGGCLEAEVSRKAWWLTRNGPALEHYQSSFDEDGGGLPWGLGCGGTVWILLEQNPQPVLDTLEAALRHGTPSVIVSRLSPWSVERADNEATEPRNPFAEVILSEPVSLSESEGSAPPPLRPATELGTAAILPGTPAAQPTQATLPPSLSAAIEQAFTTRCNLTLDATLAPTTGLPACFVEYLVPPPHLTLFGAGDDAQPIAQFAEALGWRITIADGRSHLLRPERFPAATELRLLHYTDTNHLPTACGLNQAPAANHSQPRLSTNETTTVPDTIASVDPGIRPSGTVREFAVLLTHSYEQDRSLLAALLPQPLDYLGILGPRHRTHRLIEEIAPSLSLSTEECFARLHSPVGLDLGASDPASIALSILAELQATLTEREVTIDRAPAAVRAGLSHAHPSAHA